MTVEAAIREAIVAALAARADGASICPSEVARAITGGEPGWRDLMPEVRRIAAVLARGDAIVVTQGEKVLRPAEVVDARGPIRLRRGPAFGGRD